jgi:two-component system NtrC family sensor kinase
MSSNLKKLKDQTRQAAVFFSVVLGFVVLTYVMIWGQNNFLSWQDKSIESRYAQLANLHTGSATLDIVLKKQIAASLEADKSHEYLMRICFIVLVILLLLAWLIISRINRQAQKSLVEINDELIKRNEQLAELNNTLEQRVKDRTASLTQALQDLGLTQKQLLESEKFAAIGQLASGFAHEINNPIGYINSNLQTLQKYLIHYRNLVTIINHLEEALNSKDQQEAARQVMTWSKARDDANFEFINSDIGNLISESQAGVEKIRRIVTDIHDFAKPDKGEVEAVHMPSLIDSVLNIIANQIKYKATVIKEYQSVPRVKCNAQKIAQALVNLLMNAVQSIVNKGEITIKIYQTEEHVCIAIKDTGIGISPENFSKIFDPFFTTKGSAAGLGLSASYDIVRKHNGRLTVDSHVGVGSTFTICLPYY